MLDVMTGDSDQAMAMDHARVMSARGWVRPGSDGQRPAMDIGSWPTRDHYKLRAN